MSEPKVSQHIFQGKKLGVKIDPFFCVLSSVEREGFEPSKRLNVYTLSKRAPSATRPPLQK